MRSSRPDPVNPDSGAEQPARLVHPMLVALPVAFFVIDVADRVVAGKQAAAALFEISSTSKTGPARLVRRFGGLIVVGMARHGYDLALTGYPQGWRATFLHRSHVLHPWAGQVLHWR